MGMLVEGKWQDKWYDTKKSGGAFKREAAPIRHFISNESKSKFPAETNRYHLYVSLACPWAHRCLIFRKLKNLEDHIGISIVSPNMLEHGWTFNTEEGSTGDAVNHCEYLHQIYTLYDPKYSGRVTVPVLWDTQHKTIVNNESSEIIRMFNQAFNHITNNHIDFYPEILQPEIDKINSFVYENINNGVYRCGFATTQEAYDEAFVKLFAALDKIEQILTNQRYLAGQQITEADWRLFTTLIRFDAVYYGHFKCNKYQIEDYPALAKYIRELYQCPGVAETVNFHHIKQHYYFSHTMINPTQIVPQGPMIDYNKP